MFDYSFGKERLRKEPMSSDFEWSDERDADQLISQYTDNETEGCFVKCDLEYPAELQDAQLLLRSNRNRSEDDPHISLTWSSHSYGPFAMPANVDQCHP